MSTYNPANAIVQFADQQLTLLKASVEHEQMRKFFYFSLDSLEIFLESEANRDTDTVEQFLEAARFANSLGRKYELRRLTEWLENETNK